MAAHPPNAGDFVPGETSAPRWLLNGLRRQPVAVWVGLLTGWTGLSWAPYTAYVGAILGLLIGAGVDISWMHVTSHFGANRPVSIITVVGGTLLGAGLAFVSVLFGAFVQPLQILLQVLSGGVFCIALVLVRAALEPTIVRRTGYRDLVTEERGKVEAALSDAAQRMGLSSVPAVYVQESPLLAASTGVRTIILTSNAIKLWDPAELRAVLAHELHHWRKGDTVGLRLVTAAALPLVLAYNLGYYLWFGRPTDVGANLATKPAKGVFAIVLGALIYWPAYLWVRWVIIPLMRARQRRYEFEADAAAAEIGYGPHLANALSKLAALHQTRTGWEAALNATHPSIDQRVDRLRHPGVRDYPLDEAVESHDDWWTRFKSAVQRFMYDQP